MKFAHLADIHLGSWRQPELQELNMLSFKKAIETCLEEKVDFVLFAGDLFDSAFPPIEILKDTFAEFRKLKDAGIKCYLIAGSHDFSVSGKTFLDVLEKSGFCDVCKYEIINEEEIVLKPIIHSSFYIYGYPGKKSGLEIADLRKIKIKEPYENHFRILMLHTTLSDSLGDGIPVDTIKIETLPKADYYALGHIHTDYEKDIRGKPVIYGGPVFPNNFKELEELRHGRFYIIDVEGYTKVTKKEIKLKEVILINIELENSLNGTEKIISELEKRDLLDKIVLLRVFGTLKKGNISDIKFQEIEEYIEKSNAYSFLKNTSKLETEKQELEIQLKSTEMEKIEEAIIDKYKKEEPSSFNDMIFSLIEALSIEKQEGEKNQVFESRLFSELTKILDVDLS
jgi:DNA repair protein SbcD/Mre11